MGIIFMISLLFSGEQSVSLTWEVLIQVTSVLYGLGQESSCESVPGGIKSQTRPQSLQNPHVCESLLAM